MTVIAEPDTMSVDVQEQATAEVEQQEPVSEATPLRSIRDIIKDLSKPIRPALIKTRRGAGGKDLSYIEWHTALRLLDYYAPGWSSEVRNLAISDDGHVTVVMRIYIPCLENPYPGIYREDIGGDYELGDIEKRARSFDTALVAKAQAFKRTAAQFGVGIRFYTNT